MKHHALALSLVFAAACGGGGTTTPTDDAVASYEGAITSTDVARGQVVWNEKCAGCHTEADGGYGPRVGGAHHTAAHMREQVREGSGRMPGFAADRISAEDLEALLAYLVTIEGVTP